MIVLAAFLVMPLAACSSLATRYDIIAEGYGLTPGKITAKGFVLRTYRNAEAHSPEQSLNLYLDGDGRPWRSRTSISLNPTPRQPLMLELMALDPQPSLYLGRPCYFGQEKAPGCSPLLWTSARYSETVVATMAAALEQIFREEKIQKLNLIGYSGGGVIAWLIAERLPQVTRLVTIAANLDVRAWTEHHGYSPLAASLDPSERQPLSAEIEHWHIIGTRDLQVPAKWLDDETQPAIQNAHIMRINSDHRCCWKNYWTEILRRTVASTSY
ncbi:alpha/beta fold hydrolase [Thiorhodovibrio litoralis]|uniref:alpha/beta fold hydrolase n=1 Tax=Thiorhodovibrio litoralis TaxID=2952932 RepID=UPI002B259B85|nr:alpha/beta fold hydrolase [Thiorhodovibrio litoralis]MBK5970450.1 hypothetical protein [Thiorhodovibrio winogradskyi]